MNRRDTVFALLALGAAPLAVKAQQAGKVYKIGVLSAGGVPLPERTAVFVQALRELGWVEGKNIVFESRYAEDRLDRLPELAAELVSLNVDVITTLGTLAPLAAKQATTTIPIIMGAAGDPLGSGLIASLARPGGNVTGLSMMVPELGGKRLQMLKEMLPAVSRVAILWNAANPYPGVVYKETERAARRLGIQLQSLEVRNPGDFRSAFDAAVRQHAGALLAVEDPLTIGQRTQIVDFAAKNRLPAMYGLREFVEVGGLMSYGVHFADLWRRSAGYVDKILKGAKPSALPVEQPTKFELVANLRAAKALGVTIPQSLLLQADEVIQ
jgi:putative tryptophan/tyrosine transport system substrate-binding protein